LIFLFEELENNNHYRMLKERGERGEREEEKD